MPTLPIRENQTEAEAVRLFSDQTIEVYRAIEAAFPPDLDIFNRPLFDQIDFISSLKAYFGWPGDSFERIEQNRFTRIINEMNSSYPSTNAQPAQKMAYYFFDPRITSKDTLRRNMQRAVIRCDYSHHIVRNNFGSFWNFDCPEALASFSIKRTLPNGESVGIEKRIVARSFQNLSTIIPTLLSGRSSPVETNLNQTCRIYFEESVPLQFQVIFQRALEFSSL